MPTTIGSSSLGHPARCTRRPGIAPRGRPERWGLLGIAVAGLIALVAGPGTPATAPDPAVIRVGIVSRTLFAAPLWAAQRQGYFEAEGLRVEVVVLDSQTRGFAGLKDGTLQVDLGTPEGVIHDVEAGGSLRIVAGSANRLMHSLIAANKFRRIEDLKGARIGVASAGAGTDFIIREMLARHGLRYPGDYTIAAVGGAPARWKALQEGTIDAGLQSVPLNYVAQDAGFTDLGDAAAYVPEYQFDTINVDGAWARGHADALVRFLRALLRGTRWIYEHEGPAADLIAEEMQISRAHAARGWRDFTARGALPRDLGVSRPGLAKVIAIMGASGALKVTPETRPENYLDLTYLARAHGD